MIINTAELLGAALDYAVAKSLGLNEETLDPLTWECTAYPSGCYNFATRWAQGGPIIERELIALTPYSYTDDAWNATLATPIKHYYAYGPTALVAAMRCFVASRLGVKVLLPTELGLPNFVEAL